MAVADGMIPTDPTAIISWYAGVNLEVEFFQAVFGAALGGDDD